MKHDFPETFNRKPIVFFNGRTKIIIKKISIQSLKICNNNLSLHKITSKMIKSSDQNMTEHIQALFNNIMKFGYLHTWNQVFNCPMSKLGKKDDTNTQARINI